VNPLERNLRQVTDDLSGTGVAFALVGGLAVSARAEPRLTRDADLAVAAATDDAAEAVIRKLLDLGYSAVATVEHEVSGRMATVRLTGRADDEGVVTDLLFASCGIEPEIVASAEKLSVLPGLTLFVATVGHLIAMKLLARDDRRRPADADDLAALAAIASADDWRDATRAVELIAERGYARGRDLVAALAELRDAGAY
jgi:single-stranded DNA-specific DHH superfamily exonuclease